MAKERVDINRASAEELDTIPGIGPANARRIIEHREKGNRFTCLEDLMDVPGLDGEMVKLAAKRFSYE
jgi:competence protein ComEA